MGSDRPGRQTKSKRMYQNRSWAPQSDPRPPKTPPNPPKPTKTDFGEQIRNDFPLFFLQSWCLLPCLLARLLACWHSGGNAEGIPAGLQENHPMGSVGLCRCRVPRFLVSWLPGSLGIWVPHHATLRNAENMTFDVLRHLLE